ncbi:MAG TPA: DUF1697 domain-containing protein [Kofleriaceae bacterium]|nr:DUF1697 domain-containing protein [Kofleriaceae bacterium]
MPGKVGSVPIYVALLRGINVGGSRPVKMQALRATFARVGCTNVATYIQSGNVVFAHAEKSEAKLVALVEAAIAKDAKFDVKVVVRTKAELAKIVAKNPFKKATDQQLHVFFMAKKPARDALAKVDAKAFEPEKFAIVDRELYVYLPNGLGRSKLAGTLMRKPPIDEATARNWRTVQTLVAMTG